MACGLAQLARKQLQLKPANQIRTSGRKGLKKELKDKVASSFLSQKGYLNQRC
jgi:flagellar basal body-associated protein FliL